MLTEDDIKRKFLPFLKEFYKYRYEYRPDTLETELDSVSDGGRLVADGMVRFRKTDGAYFVCTYEATSADKAGEVKFALNVLYFTWDCLAFGAVTAAVTYALAYITRLPWLVSLQGTGNAGFVLGMGLIGFFIWYFSMQNWKKYRYIYAVEQFKQYYADEQWIALADDVFPAPTDPYLAELKNQCVYNGFGLALVPERGETRVLITPSRLGIYGKDRKMVHWVTRLNWFQAVSQNVTTLNRYRPSLPTELKTTWNKLWRPAQYLLIDPVKKSLWKAYSSPLGETTAVFDRFMHAHTVQKWIFSLALLAIVPLAYRVLTLREDDVREIVERPEVNPEDQYGYLYEGESPPVRDPRGIPKQDPIPASKADEVQTIDLSGSSSDETPTINLSGDDDGIEDEPTPAKPPSSKPGKTSEAAPCATWQREKGWIIQDNLFTQKSFADERATALRRLGIDADVIPYECLGGSAGAYVVRLGATKLTESSATKQADDFSNALKRYGLWQTELVVRRLN